jgi:serine/threonine-protein kinase
METGIVKATVLFVDDEERIVNLLRMMFRGDYDVLIATSGEEALKLLRERQVDVLVSDQRMPGMLGVDLLREAKTASPATIRLLLTGYSDLSAIVGSVNDGEVFRFLNKPWDNDIIRQTIADAVEACRASRMNSQMDAAPTSILNAVAGEQAEVLLLDDDVEGIHAMSQVLGEHHQVVPVSSVAAALSALETRNIGVIVTEARIGGMDMANFLRAVKRNHPVITTVMLTSHADAGDVIRMINRAQIYRFATKPMRRSVFQLAVQGAMKEHLRLKINPELTARCQVERAHGNEDASPLAAAVARSLSRLAGLFGMRHGHGAGGRQMAGAQA